MRTDEIRTAWCGSMKVMGIAANHVARICEQLDMGVTICVLMNAVIGTP